MEWFIAILLILEGPFIILCILCGVYGSKDPNRKHLDERQLAIQNLCLRVSFYTILVYYLIYCVVAIAEPDVIAFSGYVGIATGLILTAGVYITLSIMRGAYFTAHTNTKGVLITNIILMLAWLVMALLDIEDGFVSDGRLTFLCVEIEITLMYAVITAAVLISGKREKGDEDNK